MKPETIKKIIDRTFHVDIGSNSRHQSIVFPRFVYCYMAYRQKDMYSLEYVGSVINRNHASVINAIKQYERLSSYKDFELVILKAERAITESIETEMERREKLRTQNCVFRVRRYLSLKTI